MLFEKISMDWLKPYFPVVNHFPKPKWKMIAQEVEKNHANDDSHKIWHDISQYWVNRILAVLPHQYAAFESENFILVTSESQSYVEQYLKFLEYCLKKILSTLHSIASDKGYGKLVVFIVDDMDQYYQYISDYYPEGGEYGLSSGIYLNDGYGHFVFPHQELTQAESITAHEMTHALLSHLPIPAWLNEGMATGIENLLTHSSPLLMDSKSYQRHQSFWGEPEIQEFWNGDAFYRTDEGQSLSYDLAQFAVHSLSQDYPSFIEFANQAHFKDGGEAAAHVVFGGSLGNLIQQFFGPGNWQPKPELWGDSFREKYG